ncbi:hypothetical protein niasHS_003853 [Heterodera schachtii]
MCSIPLFFLFAFTKIGAIDETEKTITSDQKTGGKMISEQRRVKRNIPLSQREQQQNESEGEEAEEEEEERGGGRGGRGRGGQKRKMKHREEEEEETEEDEEEHNFGTGRGRRMGAKRQRMARQNRRWPNGGRQRPNRRRGGGAWGGTGRRQRVTKQKERKSHGHGIWKGAAIGGALLGTVGTLMGSTVGYNMGQSQNMNQVLMGGGQMGVGVPPMCGCNGCLPCGTSGGGITYNLANPSVHQLLPPFLNSHVMF